MANGTLLLINAATYFLKRQLESKAEIFLKNGGFSEQMLKKTLTGAQKLRLKKGTK